MKSLTVFAFGFLFGPRLACFTGIAVAGLLVSAASADDWPHWMGPTGDGVWHEPGIIDGFEESGAKILWRQPLGGGYAGPAIAGGRVFIMDRTADEGVGGEVENDIRKRGEVAGGERVQCLDAASGTTLWEYSWNCPYTIAYPTGPRCTPTVDGKYVYVLGAMGNLICLEVAHGDVVWEKSLAKEYGTKPPPWGYASHPFVDGDRLFVAVGGTGTGVVAFDKNTGAELWRAVTTKDVAYAPLVIFEPLDGKGERQLVFWHADGVTSIDPDSGSEYWTVRFPEETNPSQTSIATPRVVGDSIFISEFYKGSLLLRVSSDPPGVTETWRSSKIDAKLEKSLNCMMASPLIRDGFAYGIGYDARGNGILRCIELQSGELQWTEEAWMSEKPLMFATAFAVENNGRYWMFNDKGELMITELSPAGYREIDRAAILEPTSAARGRKVVWSHPAFAGGCMVARNDKEIVCVDLRKPDGK
jgi:outer membrane protein assembly factor BamB